MHDGSAPPVLVSSSRQHGQKRSPTSDPHEEEEEECRNQAGVSGERAPGERLLLGGRLQALFLGLFWDPVIQCRSVGDDEWAGNFFEMWKECGEEALGVEE